MNITLSRVSRLSHQLIYGTCVCITLLYILIITHKSKNTLYVGGRDNRDTVIYVIVIFCGRGGLNYD